MSREQGRRAATPSAGRTGIFALVVVALSVGMLALAGTTPRGIGRPVEDPSRVLLDQRTFSCDGGIGGTSTRSGDLTTGLAATRKVPDRPTTPQVLTVDREFSAGAFAGQQATTARGTAWLPCPEPRARWWFVAAGGAAITHDTVLTLSNPRTGDALVDITVYGPEGIVESPDFRNVPVPARSSRVIDLARTAPAVGNLAVSVRATRGLVAASAVDRFAPGAVGTTAVEWLPSTSPPDTSVTLSGLPALRTSSTLVVANPNEVEAIVEIQVVGTSGTFVPTGLADIIVSPNSVATVPVSTVVDGTPMALTVTSTQKVTATVRSIRGEDTAFASGARVLRGGTAFAVPDGKGTLVLSSLRTGGTARLIAFGADGQRLAEEELEVERRTSRAFALPAGTRYLRLGSIDGDIVAGFSVVPAKGLAGSAVTPALNSVRLPKVRLAG